jgi:hypothetical protein
MTIEEKEGRNAFLEKENQEKMVTIKQVPV